MIVADPKQKQNEGAVALSALEDLKEKLGEARGSLGEFVALAESGALRVGSARAGAVRVEDEALTQLMLSLDAVALPVVDEALRSMRKSLIQDVHDLSKTLTAADEAAAAKAEEPDEVAVTRRAEGDAAHSSGDFEAAIDLYTEAISAMEEASAGGGGGFFATMMGRGAEADDQSEPTVDRFRCLMGRAASCAGAGRYAAGLQDWEMTREMAAQLGETHAADMEAVSAEFSGHTVAAVCLRQLGRLSEAAGELAKAPAGEAAAAAAEGRALRATEQVLARVAQFVMGAQPGLALDSLLPIPDKPNGSCVAAPEVTACMASIRLRVGDTAGAAAGYTKAAAQADAQEPHAYSRTPSEWQKEADLVEQGAALKARGNDLFKAGDFEGAVELYEQAVSLLPMCAPLYTNLAAALAQADNGTRQYDAVSACDAAIKIDQAFLKARVRRATCLSALERHDEAVAEMRTAMELDPQNKEVMEKLQLIELAAGIAQEDEQDIQRRFGGGGGSDEDDWGGGGGGGGGNKKKKKNKGKKKKR